MIAQKINELNRKFSMAETDYEIINKNMLTLKIIMTLYAMNHMLYRTKKLDHEKYNLLIRN